MSALSCLALALLAQDAPALDAPIREVTVYRSGAFVKRAAAVPPGAARVLLRGLPAELDRDALRVHCQGAEVVGVETRDRIEAAAPEERVAELRAELQALEDRLVEERDAELVLEGLRTRVESLLRGEERLAAARAAGAADGAAGREERLAWLAERLSELGARKREVARRIEETQDAIEDAKLALGRVQPGDGTPVVDVLVELAGAGAAPPALEVEYLVGRAGWTPAYDLRAPKDLSALELVYRASVVQRTGEDWSGVELVLSTAEPRRGAVDHVHRALALCGERLAVRDRQALRC